MCLRRISLLQRLVCTLTISTMLPSIPCAWGQGLAPVFHERLQRLCSQNNSSVILWDIPGGKPIGGFHEEVFFTPHCVGSLIKPFLLLAYLREHQLASSLSAPQNKQDQEPVGREVFRPCRGKSTPTCPIECWYKSGHGCLSLTESLAYSCNQYFYQLAHQTSEESLLRILREYRVLEEGQPSIEDMKNPLLIFLQLTEARIGLSSQVRLVPIRILLACLTILEASLKNDASGGLFLTPEQTVSAGLALSAVSGTSQLAQQALPPGQHIAGKTGTSSALSDHGLLPNKTDGWFMGFYPPVQPSVAVMVKYPNGLGAKHAAPLGGQVLRLYLELTRP